MRCFFGVAVMSVGFDEALHMQTLSDRRILDMSFLALSGNDTVRSQPSLGMLNPPQIPNIHKIMR